MAMIPGIQEDYASYLHCQLHLTHLLSNAHDLLYPSKSRSIALATAEHYYKHIEAFSDGELAASFLLTIQLCRYSDVAGRGSHGIHFQFINAYGSPL